MSAEMSSLHTLTEAQAAYIAGIIDGEGYIGLCANRKSFTLRVAVKTTSEPLTKWLAAATGSRTNAQVHKDTRTDFARRRCYEWRVFGDQARQLLEMIRPYLLLKQKQADLATEYQTLSSDEKANRGLSYREQIKEHNLLIQGKIARAAESAAG